MDSRDLAALRRSSTLIEDDHEHMQIIFEDGDDNKHRIPAKYEVCPLCEGKGKHVDPAIDAHGISAEEMNEDPDFAEDYMSGRFDITCNECGGMRVILVPSGKIPKEEMDLFCQIQESARQHCQAIAAEQAVGA